MNKKIKFTCSESQKTRKFPLQQPRKCMKKNVIEDKPWWSTVLITGKSHSNYVHHEMGAQLTVKEVPFTLEIMLQHCCSPH